MLSITSFPHFERRACDCWCGNPLSLSFIYTLFQLDRRCNCATAFNMDAPEPEQTPFAAVTAHTTRIQRVGSRDFGFCFTSSCLPGAADVLTMASNTKRFWTSQLRMSCTDGSVLPWPCFSSSCAFSWRKDGTLVSLCCNENRGEEEMNQQILTLSCATQSHTPWESTS